MKKLLALILALVMCFSLVACGGDKAEEKPAEESKAPAAEESKAPAAEESKAPAAEQPKDELAEWAAKAEGKEYNVLYIPNWAAAEYFQNSHAVWKKMFAELGWNLDMQGPEKYTAESQLSVLESALLSQQYDAIIMYPIDPASVEAVLDDMWETYHVPIIQWGFPESFGGGHYYICSDNRYEATGDDMFNMAIEYVEDNMDYFKAEYLDKGKKIPFILAGQASNSVQNVRGLRAMELALADGRFELLHHFENVTGTDALAIGETITMNYPEVEVIFVHNDPTSIGFDTAFKTVGTMKPTLRMFGSDATRAAVAMMVDEGEDCMIGGSSGANHHLMGNIIIDLIKVAVPASEEGEVVPAATVKAKAIYMDAVTAGTAQDKVTWKNAQEYVDRYYSE